MLDFAREFFAYIKAHKKWWLLPVFAALVLVGGLLLLSQMSAIGPFIYTIF